MKCKSCGKKLKRNERFCLECGYYNGDSNANMLFGNDDNHNLEDDNFTGPLPDEDIFNKEKDKHSKKIEINNFEQENEDYDIDTEFDDSFVTINNEEYDDIDSNFDKIQKQVKKEQKTAKAIQKKFIEKSNEDTNYYGEDEDLIESYIGEDYKIIKKMPFNIYAFIFNWLYFLYRKLYITGTIGLIVTLFIIKFVQNYLVIYLIVIMIILGLVFNKYYILICKRRIKKIKTKYEGSDRFNLNIICEEKGGVNYVYALIIYFIFLVITIYIIAPFNITFANKKSKYWQVNSENMATCNSIAKKAYNDTIKNNNYDPTEGICKKMLSSDNYELYLKINNKSTNTYMYAYYKTEDNYLIFKSNTENKNELMTKKANNIITEEESKKLSEMTRIENNYLEFYNKAKKEDELIKKNKDTNQKYHFIFNKNELFR